MNDAHRFAPTAGEAPARLAPENFGEAAERPGAPGSVDGEYRFDTYGRSARPVDESPRGAGS